MRPSHLRLVTLLVLVSLTACGRVDQPQTAQALQQPSALSTESVPPTGEATRAIPTMAFADPTDATPTVALPTTAAPVPTTALVIPTDIPPTAEPLVTTVPIGPRLRDVWPQTPSTVAPANYLIYSDVVDDAPDHKSFALWQLDLHDLSKRQKITDITVSDFTQQTPVVGSTSPDGTTIAYLVPTGDSDADLHVIQRDGTHDHIIMQQIASTVSRGRPRFVWSPDSTQLAFIKYAEQGQDFYVYDRHADTSRRIAQVGGAGLAGWTDNHHVLIHMVTDQDKPQQITSIDSTTGAQESLGIFPRKGAIAALLSPDNSAVLIEEYLFDVATRHFTKLDQLQAPAIWSGDSHALLSVPYDSAGSAHVISLAQPTHAISVTVVAHPDPASVFEIAGSSPNGQYLLLCEHHSVTADQIVDSAWLYDLTQGSQHLLKQGEARCLGAVGWQSS